MTLCADCHRGTEGAQYDSETGDYLKREAQIAYEETHSRAEWMALIMKNYLKGDPDDAKPSVKGFDQALERD